MAHHILIVPTSAEGALLLEKDPKTGKPSADAHRGFWAYDVEGGVIAAGDTIDFANNGKVLARGRVVNFQSLQEYKWAAGFQMQCSRSNSVVFKWEDTGPTHAEAEQMSLRGMAHALGWPKPVDPPPSGVLVIPPNTLKVGDKIRVQYGDPPEGEEQDRVL